MTANSPFLKFLELPLYLLPISVRPLHAHLRDHTFNGLIVALKGSV